MQTGKNDDREEATERSRLLEKQKTTNPRLINCAHNDILDDDVNGIESGLSILSILVRRSRGGVDGEVGSPNERGVRGLTTLKAYFVTI